MTNSIPLYIYLVLSRVAYKLYHPDDWLANVKRVDGQERASRPLICNPYPCCLSHGVILGSSTDACCRNWMRSHRVAAVLNVTPDVPCFFANDGIIYKQIGIGDDSRHHFSGELLDEASEFMSLHSGNKRVVFVHCVMGRSRSVCVCCYHFMKRYGMSFIDIYTTIKDMRPQVHVNQNFIYDLKREFPLDTTIDTMLSSNA
jgi:hypothetical protein